MRLTLCVLLFAAACGNTPPAVCGDLKLDDKNCGACGHACASVERCANGACFPSGCGAVTCDPDSVCVQDRCVDRSCVGVVCPSGQTCSRGSCVCGPDRLACGGACVDPKLDDQNCGACGNACAAGTACAAGGCLPLACGTATCDALSVCWMGACTGRECVGVVCPAGKVCGQGACGCPNGGSDCGGTCANLTSDEMNCGMCGRSCAAGSECVAGVCTALECGTLTACGGKCANLMTDSEHCGACGRSCGPGRSCVGGQCECPPGLSFCGSACVNLVNDPLNCGACSRSCSGGLCDGGTCSCAPGYTPCGGACSVTSLDPLNCGMCGRACATDGGETCQGGMCRCAPGRSLCGGRCIDTTHDNLNCGMCGMTCGGVQQCVDSLCKAPITCQAGFNPPDGGCGLVPFNPAGCGQKLFRSRDRYTGMGNATIPLDGGKGDTWDLAGSSSGSWISVCGANNTGSGCISGYSTDNRFGGGVMLHDLVTNPYACTNPAQVYVSSPGGPTIGYDLNLDHYAFSGNWGIAGTTAVAAPLLAVSPSTGLTCDQFCGECRATCDYDHFYRFMLPARRAALIDGVFEQAPNASLAYAIFELRAQTAAGGTVCSLIPVQTITPPTQYRTRLVSNLDVDQEVVLQVQCGRQTRWNVAVMIEP